MRRYRFFTRHDEDVAPYNLTKIRDIFSCENGFLVILSYNPLIFTVFYLFSYAFKNFLVAFSNTQMPCKIRIADINLRQLTAQAIIKTDTEMIKYILLFFLLLFLYNNIFNLLNFYWYSFILLFYPNFIKLYWQNYHKRVYLKYVDIF